MPGTPQHNGIAEMRNHTLLDMERCMLVNSLVPEFLRDEALKTVAYILIQVSNKSVSKTSYELWCPALTPRLGEERGRGTGLGLL